MVDTTRRGFFRFGAGALLIAAAAPLVEASSLPRLWADGVHDDTAALQALLDGESVLPMTTKAKRTARLDGGLVLCGGTYRTSAAIRLRRDGITMQDFTIMSSSSDHAIVLESSNSSLIRGMIDMRGTAGAAGICVPRVFFDQNVS